MPLWAQAGFWGAVAGSALIVGALAGYSFKLRECLTAANVQQPERSAAHVFRSFRSGVTAATIPAAAGAMPANAMSPEAFKQAHNVGGLMTIPGVPAAFLLSKARA